MDIKEVDQIIGQGGEAPGSTQGVNNGQGGKLSGIEYMEYEHELILEVGTIADHISVASDDIRTVRIGSDIEPMKIGHAEYGDFENGVSEIHDYYLIVQRGLPILIDAIEGGQNYGGEYQKNGGWKEFKAYALKEMPIDAIDLKRY